MGSAFDFQKIDWANESVNNLVEIFSEKFTQMEKDKDSLIDQQSETINKLTEANNELKKEIALLKAAGRRSRKSRSYNIRKYKEHPRPPDDRKAKKRAL